jgi:hypothetical protein
MRRWLNTRRRIPDRCPAVRADGNKAPWDLAVACSTNCGDDGVISRRVDILNIWHGRLPESAMSSPSGGGRLVSQDFDALRESLSTMNAGE